MRSSTASVICPPASRPEIACVRHHRDDLVPFLVVERVAHLERAVLLVDAV